MSWKDYLDSINEAKRYKKRVSRKSGKGIERSLKTLLDLGPQKKGGYKNKRARFGKKKFNNVSHPLDRDWETLFLYLLASLIESK